MNDQALPAVRTPRSGEPERKVNRGSLKSDWILRWRCTLAGLVLLAVLALPPVRAVMESSMAVHMLVQYPGLMFGGALLAGGLSPTWKGALAKWNNLGISGLAFVTLSLAVLMIPRVLDLALTDTRVEVFKWATLVACGMALALSWRLAGAVIQVFFLGNLLPMMAVAGILYQEATLQLCNAYRVEEQQFVGMVLPLFALSVGSVWLIWKSMIIVKQ